MNKSISLLCLIIVNLVASAKFDQPISLDLGATAPGFKTVLTQGGFDYLKDVGLNYLAQSLHTVTVPDQSGDADTPVGHVDWSLTGIVVSQLTIGSATIALNPGTGLTLTLENINVVMSSNWKYRKNHWPHVSDHGTADVMVESTNVVVALQVTASNNRPYLTVLSDNISIGKLDVKLHGGASWLYDFLINLLKGSIRHSIENALTTAITKNIDTGLNNVLSTLPVSDAINSQVEINFELMSNPTFAANYATLNQLGEFFAIANPVECPAQYCAANSLPDVTNANYMIQMILGDYVANSGAFVYYKLDFLNVNVTDAEVPSWAPVRLNTTYFKYILPQLYSAYPDNLLIVNVYATDVPKVTFNAQGAAITAVGELSFYVVETSGDLAHAFTLSGSVVTNAVALIRNQLIYANMTYVSSSFSLKESDIGPFDPTVLDSLMTLFMSQGVVPTMNTYLAQGIQLPVVPGLTFVSPVIEWSNGYLTVSTNIQYTPPSSIEIINKNNNNNNLKITIQE